MKGPKLGFEPEGNKSRALVTGGGGFLGSHLCDALVSSGLQVWCLDDFSTGSLHNVSHLLSHERFSLLDRDVAKPIYLDVGQVFNLACPASPVHYQERPIQTTVTSVCGALNMLELALRGCSRIFQASTSEVYGDPEEHPQSEEYRGCVSPTGPRSCYDEGKRCAESLFMSYHLQYLVDVKIARIFNTYGPRMQVNDGRVVSNFVVQALTNRPITIFGSGEQTRSFCYVTDMVEGIMRLMATSAEITGPINLGNPEEHTICELAETIRDLTNSKSAIVRKPLPRDDPRMRCPDTTKAEAHLGWRPKVGLRQGLASTVAYFEQMVRRDALGYPARQEAEATAT